MFQVVRKSYCKRGNPKPKDKSSIESEDIEKLKSYFSVECPGKLQEFVWFNQAGMGGRDSQITRSNSSKTKNTEQSKNYQSGSKHTDQNYTASVRASVYELLQ